MGWLITPYHQDCLRCDTLALPYYAIWFQCSFHFYIILCTYNISVTVGGNLVRFGIWGAGNKADFFFFMDFILSSIKKAHGLAQKFSQNHGNQENYNIRL